jgi:hypothetical protein
MLLVSAVWNVIPLSRWGEVEGAENIILQTFSVRKRDLQERLALAMVIFTHS